MVLATACVVALASRAGGRAAPSSLSVAKSAAALAAAKHALRQASLQAAPELKHATALNMPMLEGNTTNSTGGNATVEIPAEDETPFDLSAWLRTQPDGTW